MNHRTRGIVIALACLAAGGLLPAAVSEQMTGAHLMAVGLGTVVFLNAVIAFIHIGGSSGADRMREAPENADASHAPRAASPAPAAMRSAPTDVKYTQQAAPQEPLNFPVLGWYALPQEGEEPPVDAAMNKPKKAA